MRPVAFLNKTARAFVQAILSAALCLGPCSHACLAKERGELPEDAGPGFTVVTEASGLARIISDHYATHADWWLSGLHLVDLDGDGELDIFLSAHGRGVALAALNDGEGHYSLAPGRYPPSEILSMYDSDEDGRLDVAMTHQDGGARWWRNLSRPGELRFEATDVSRGTNTSRRQALIDIDRDGKVDWLRGRGGRISFDMGNGRGHFSDGERHLATGGDRRAEVLCLPQDLDGDGDIDLLAEWGHYGAPAGNSRIYLNDGTMQFADVTTRSGLTRSGTSIKGVGDFDQDGDPDLICLESRKRFAIFRNDGRASFQRAGQALGDVGKSPSMATTRRKIREGGDPLAAVSAVGHGTFQLARARSFALPRRSAGEGGRRRWMVQTPWLFWVRRLAASR